MSQIGNIKSRNNENAIEKMTGAAARKTEEHIWHDDYSYAMILFYFRQINQKCGQFVCFFLVIVLTGNRTQHTETYPHTTNSRDHKQIRWRVNAWKKNVKRTKHKKKTVHKTGIPRTQQRFEWICANVTTANEKHENNTNEFWDKRWIVVCVYGLGCERKRFH